MSSSQELSLNDSEDLTQILCKTLLLKTVCLIDNQIVNGKAELSMDCHRNKSEFIQLHGDEIYIYICTYTQNITNSTNMLIFNFLLTAVFSDF